MIGVFDSGAGGLSVVRALKARVPEQPLLYFGDTARVPYGNKSATLITNYTKQALDFLVQQGATAIVIACHTASAVAAEEMRKIFKIPIYDVVKPGVAEAAKQAKKSVGVIGTTTSIQSQVHTQLLKKMRPDLEIQSQACPLFVPLVEEQWLDLPVTAEIAEIYLAHLRNLKIDTLILACTHYPWLRNVIQATIGTDVLLIDPAEELALELVTTTEKNSETKVADRYFASDTSATLEALAATFLPQAPKVEIIKLS